MDAIPDDPIANVAGWPRWNALLPHIDAVTAHIGPGHDNPDLLYLGDRAATYRQFQGQLAPAISCLSRSSPTGDGCSATSTPTP